MDYNASIARVAEATGFFISPNQLLTAGHVVKAGILHMASPIRVAAGGFRRYLGTSAAVLVASPRNEPSFWSPPAK